MDIKDFHTFGEYIKRDSSALTPAMEDYLEMIYRLSESKGYTRINDLSSALNIQPPSASRMARKLAESGYVNAEKHGLVILTESGKSVGKFLLYRHHTIEKFIIFLGVKENILEQTEKIEHAINYETLECMIKFMKFTEENDDISKIYEKYLNS